MRAPYSHPPIRELFPLDVKGVRHREVGAFVAPANRGIASTRKSAIDIGEITRRINGSNRRV